MAKDSNPKETKLPLHARNSSASPQYREEPFVTARNESAVSVSESSAMPIPDASTSPSPISLAIEQAKPVAAKAHHWTNDLSVTVPIPGATHHFPNNDGLNTMNPGLEVNYSPFQNKDFKLDARDFRNSYDRNTLMVGGEYLPHVPHLPENIHAGVAAGLDVTALRGGGYAAENPASPFVASGRIEAKHALLGNDLILDVIPGPETAVSASVRVPLSTPLQGAHALAKKIRGAF